MSGKLQKQIVVWLSILMVLTLFFNPGQTATAQSDSPTDNTTVQDNHLFLPVISDSVHPRPSVFGVEMNRISGTMFTSLSSAGTTWIRRAAIHWSDVEPTPGARNWSTPAVVQLENELRTAAADGIRVILVVRQAPEWARTNSTYACSAVRTDAFDALNLFMRDLVRRYSKAPYRIKYWEMWNEPDIATNQPGLVVEPTNLWGCWGDYNDAYYGGGYYASMLQSVYPVIKANDPNAQVLMGGLLLDCNPNLPAANCTEPKPGKFFEGILRAGGGNYFDGVNFHAYDYYGGRLGVYGQNGFNSISQTTGPVSLAKAQYLKDLMAQYNVTGKFMMNTEAALLCTTCDKDADFETTKAYYVAQTYSSAVAIGLRANTWYSASGWRNSGLFENGVPTQAFTAYEFARAEISNAKLDRQITEFSASNIMGYSLNRGDRIIWVLWAKDNTNHVLTLEETPRIAYDVFGNVYATTGTSVTVGSMPIYIEFTP